MDLKQGVAVCLISLFSATLVVLIARALDLHAASRLEPQLARIVEELEAIRKSGGITAGSGVAAENEPVGDALMVYYFHGNIRCPTCKAIESQSQETVHSDFASQLDSAEMVWKVLNYEEPAADELAKRFEIQMPVIVLARMKGGQIQDWKRLDEVWALVGDQPAFAEYIRNEVNKMLRAAAGQPTLALPDNVSETPVPAVDPSNLPVPGAAAEPRTPSAQIETADKQPTPAPNGNPPENLLRASDPSDIPIPTTPGNVPVLR